MKTTAAFLATLTLFSAAPAFASDRVDRRDREMQRETERMRSPMESQSDANNKAGSHRDGPSRNATAKDPHDHSAAASSNEQRTRHADCCGSDDRAE